MILRFRDLLFVDPAAFLQILGAFLLTGGVALLVGITFHEFSHALVADRLGDGTARRLGRLSLNPLAHLDPIGTAMLLLVGFGWGKPVPVNPLAFGSNAFKGMSLVALAGPLSNTAVASVAALPFKMGILAWRSPSMTTLFSRGPEGFLADLLWFIVFYNLILAVFNLIPLAPLDGSKVALGLLPRDAARSFARLEPWGPGILLSVILLDAFANLGILSQTILPAVNFLAKVLVGSPLL